MSERPTTNEPRAAQESPRRFKIGEGPQHADAYSGTLDELAAVSWEEHREPGSEALW